MTKDEYAHCVENGFISKMIGTKVKVGVQLDGLAGIIYGTIADSDKDTVVIECGGKKTLVYKHSIKYITES